MDTPTNLLAEKAVLGSILLNNTHFYECDSLTPDDFSMVAHKRLYGAMVALSEARRPIDVLTLDEHMGIALEAIGGPAYVCSLVDGVPERPNIANYVRMVADMAQRRRLIATCEAAVNQARDDSETTADCLSVTLERVTNLAAESGDHKPLQVKDFADGVFDAVIRQSMSASEEIAVGLPTGITRLDRDTTGIRPGEFWVIGGATNSGKTPLLTQIMLENLERGRACLLFSLEMKRDAILMRMIPKKSAGVIKPSFLRDARKMTDYHRAEFEKLRSAVKNWPLWVNDISEITATQLAAQAKLAIARHHIKLIGVDFLSLMSGPQSENRTLEMTAIVLALRNLAKDTGVPVVAISQLSRQPDKHNPKPPVKEQLLGAGAIEQAAHVILLTYMPTDENRQRTGDNLIIVDKQRDGLTGAIPVRFDTLTLTFEEQV